MPLAAYNGVAMILSGGFLVPAGSATIEVRREDNNTLASIYSDEGGTVPITNPSVFGDSNGRFRFYAAGIDRGYKITVTQGGNTYTLRTEAVGNAQQRDTTAFTLTPVNQKSGAYTVVAADLATVIEATANSWTLSLTAAATLGSGFNCYFRNSGSGVITIDPNSSETIDGSTTILVAPGEGFQLVCNGTNWRTVGRGVGGEFKSTQIFSGSGTWTKPAGLKRVKVTVVGGGGAGGGAPATGAGQHSLGAGGGGGGAAIEWINASAMGSTETVTVGAGGTAGSGNGNAGGTSSFGSYCSATGGAGGEASGPGATPGMTGAAGGVGSGGALNIAGQGSIPCWSSFGTSSVVPGGAGGNSLLGGGGRGTSQSNAGVAGGAYGGGGGGAAAANNVGPFNGGAGAAGIVIVEEFF